MQLSEAFEALNSKISEFQQAVREKALAQQNRQTLVKTLQEFNEKSEELKQALAEISQSAKAENSTIETSIQENAVNELSVFLKRNLDFEKDKLSRSNPFNEILERQETVETFSAVEEKVKKTLLGLQYFLEKSTIALHSELKTFAGSKQAQNVLQLLKLKDLELESLKKAHNALLSKGLLARIEEQTSADFEDSLNQTARDLDVSGSELQKLALENRAVLERLQKSQAVLEQKIRQSDELLSRFQSKSLETITVLKKERDSARKFALDLEHETSSIRHAYSKEMLSMQEHKMQLQKEMQQGFVQKTKSLETELKQKSEFLEHFKKLVEEKEAELRLLKEKFEHQKTILHHYARHKTARKKHSKSTV